MNVSLMCGNVLGPTETQNPYFYRVYISALGVREQRNIHIEDQNNFKQK